MWLPSVGGKMVSVIFVAFNVTKLMKIAWNNRMILNKRKVDSAKCQVNQAMSVEVWQLFSKIGAKNMFSIVAVVQNFFVE